MNKEEFFKIVPATKNLQNSLNSYLFIEAAEKIGLEVKYIQGTDYFVIEKGDCKKTVRVDNNRLNFSAHALLIINDKAQTKIFLENNNVSTPRGHCIYKNYRYDLDRIFESLTKPLVVKPANATYGGEGVKVGVGELDVLKGLVESNLDKYSSLIIEEEFEYPDEYRILATRKSVLAITKRVPANVVGDGTSDIKKLIEEKNSDPNRGGHDYKKPLLKIEIDDNLIENLKEQEMSLSFVPEKSKKIYLRKTSNLSQGGDSVDYTEEAHESVKEIAIRAINSVPGLPYSGVDFMTKDIAKEQKSEDYRIIEMNGSPMISMHHFPYEGKGRNVAESIIREVFNEK